MMTLNDVRKEVKSVVNEILNAYCDEDSIFDSICVVLNVLYRAKHNLPYCFDENNHFQVAQYDIDNPFFLDNLEDEEMWVINFISDKVNKLLELDHDLYCQVYPEIVDELFINIKNGNAGEFFQPNSLSKLILSLLETKGITNLYNPFAGLGSYAIGFNGFYRGQEINAETCHLGQIRIEAHDEEYAILETSNSVENWTPQDANCIVSTPPFGIRIDSDKYRGYTYVDFLMEKFISSEVDYAYYIVPTNVCYSTARLTTSLRERITESNNLDMVITLPSNFFANTGISTSVVVLSKKRVSNRVIFINASNLFNVNKEKGKSLDNDAILSLVAEPNGDNCVIVDNNVITANSYSWFFPKYKKESRTDIPEGFKAVKLREILNAIRPQRNFSETEGYAAYRMTLSAGIEDFIKSPENLYYDNDLQHVAKIVEPVLLVSTDKDLRPTYCMASPEKPIYIKPNILAFRLNSTKVIPAYLCLELSRTKFDAYGIAVPHITKDMILDTEIYLPPLENQNVSEEQENIYREAINSLKLARAREFGLMDVIDRMKKNYMNEVRTRKHDMMPYVRELGSFERTIRHYVSKRDDMPDFSEKMNSLLDRYKDNLAKLSELINIFTEEQQFGEPEQFNLNKYLIELETSHDESKGYWIEYDRDDNALAEYGIPVSLGVYTDTFEPVEPDSKWGKELIEEECKFPVIVEINHLDFERLVRNIIENAITHGFTDPNRNDYGIGIDLTVDMERGMFQIDFSNNGTPLPSGMDKQRYGLLGEKAGLTGRTGRGGYIIKSIVEHYHGDYDVFMNGSNTVVRILLPIAHYDYEYDI